MLKKVHTIEENESQVIDSMEDYDREIDENAHLKIRQSRKYVFITTNSLMKRK